MKKKILSDVILNTIATLVPMVTLQFLILPLIASKMMADEYGQLLTIVSLINLSAATLGNIMNNSRLINYKRYDELEIKGDYNLLLIIFAIINIIFMLLGLWYYGRSLDHLSVVLILLASTFLLLKNYTVVEFRIKLNFKYILINSLLIFVGYIVGFILFLISDYWQLIYLCGFLFSFLFVFKKTVILKEPLIKTQLFKKTTNQIITLLISGILLALGTYIDRLLLYPMLGGVAVSIYYTSTILGKTISLVIQPITGVLLSYFAQLNKFENRNFYLLLGISTVVGAIGYVFTILVSKPILSILYPQYVNDAMEYIHVTTISIVIIIITNILNAVVLKFCDVSWQLVINISYMLIYIIASLVLLNIYGLMGFCIGILIASIVKLIVMIVAYYFNDKLEIIKKRRKNNGYDYRKAAK